MIMSAEQFDGRMNFDLTIYSYHGLIEESWNAILVATSSYLQRDVKNITGHRRRSGGHCVRPREHYPIDHVHDIDQRY